MENKTWLKPPTSSTCGFWSDEFPSHLTCLAAQQLSRACGASTPERSANLSAPGPSLKSEAKKLQKNLEKDCGNLDIEYAPFWFKKNYLSKIAIIVIKVVLNIEYRKNTPSLETPNNKIKSYLYIPYLKNV